MSVVPSEQDKSTEQKAAESEVESFRKDLGPFVVAAETTRMAMVFTDAKESSHPLIFANDSFLSLAGYSRKEIVGQSFDILLGRPADPAALALIEGAFAGSLKGKMSYPVADVLAARGVPFVFSTAYAKDRILESYQQFPMLQKPFHRTELGAMLVKLLKPNEPSVEPATARGQ